MSSADTVIGRRSNLEPPNIKNTTGAVGSSTTSTSMTTGNNTSRNAKARTIEVTPEALIGMVQLVDKNSTTLFNLIEKLTELSLANQKETAVLKEQLRKSEKKRGLLQKELDFTRDQVSLVSNKWRSTDSELRQIQEQLNGINRRFTTLEGIEDYKGVAVGKPTDPTKLQQSSLVRLDTSQQSTCLNMKRQPGKIQSNSGSRSRPI